MDSTNPFSPIVKAVGSVSKKSTGEVHVHVVSHFFEKDVLGAALHAFNGARLYRTTHRNGVLIYLNRFTRKFAIIADEGVHRVLGQRYWDELAIHFREDLLSTHFENAIALVVYSLAESMGKKFPKDLR